MVFHGGKVRGFAIPINSHQDQGLSILMSGKKYKLYKPSIYMAGLWHCSNLNRDNRIFMVLPVSERLHGGSLVSLLSEGIW